eukprot:CAMPEP_0172747008 /NCGR_PEP_ID=MMETSP1074-20121228/141842_1 /TAXON_ID=2916 /ORGANISM="Ceratium fusus, Strain PA161109" /LENGTH=93 /DNA_ID=CAMNT_0013578463 /DNA_START=140 /DNA_END=417 /DNA_ORIENTATION=+
MAASGITSCLFLKEKKNSSGTAKTEQNPNVATNGTAATPTTARTTGSSPAETAAESDCRSEQHGKFLPASLSQQQAAAESSQQQPAAAAAAAA